MRIGWKYMKWKSCHAKPILIPVPLICTFTYLCVFAHHCMTYMVLSTCWRKFSNGCTRSNDAKKLKIEFWWILSCVPEYYHYIELPGGIAWSICFTFPYVRQKLSNGKNLLHNGDKSSKYYSLPLLITFWNLYISQQHHQ